MPKKKSESKPITDDNSDPPMWTIWAATSYVIIMLVIGLPLWWKTTTVQRVPLPYPEMLSLYDFFEDKLKISVPIKLKGFSGDIENIRDDLYATIEARTNSVYSLQLSNDIMASDEMDIIYKLPSLDEIDMAFCKISKAKKEMQNQIQIYFVGRADFFRSNLGTPKLIFGNCHSAYYISNSGKIGKELVSVLAPSLVHQLEPKSLKDDKDDRKLELSLSAGYDVLLTLLVPQPEILDAKWEIEKGVNRYLQPMINKLSSFAEFSIRSQVLYYVKLNVSPQKNEETGLYEIPNNQLPLVINPVESKLTSFVSQNPALNFLVYVCPCNEHPLQILDENGEHLKSNAFFVPQWGGIQVYNGPCERLNDSSEAEQNGKSEIHQVSMDQVMSVIITQFRALIGLPEIGTSESHLDFNGSALRDWEVDMIVRKRLQNLIFTAANTLKSLGNLLDQITNIVVTEQVGEQVEKSVASLKSAFAEADSGNLESAQREAVSAYKASEIAFHHPTNLAQLYFPDDQKYAIYIPLFLPVGIPVLYSLRLLIKAFNRFKGKDKVE